MRILVSEKLSEHKFKDNNGYLICTNCILSRTGAQTYKRNEVFNDGSDEEIEINRTANEVFSSEALASFENCPVCIEHPEVDVNPENHNELSVGFVRNVKKGTDNGEDVMLGDLVITDADAINLIESGEMTELSCGYNCDISDEEAPQQLNIRGNHVALCEKGRAGIARIVDSIDDVVRREGDFTIENEDDHYVIKRDGRKLLRATKMSEAIEMAHNGEAEEKYNEKTGKTKEDKYIIKATDVRGMYINQKGAGEYTHYSNAKRFDKRTAEAKVNAMNRSNGIHKWAIEKVNDSIEDSYVDYLALEKKIKNAKSRNEIKRIMAEVDAHKDDGLLTKTEYLKLVKLSETTKDSITTHRIHSIINLIK